MSALHQGVHGFWVDSGSSSHERTSHGSNHSLQQRWTLLLSWRQMAYDGMDVSLPAVGNLSVSQCCLWIVYYTSFLSSCNLHSVVFRVIKYSFLIPFIQREKFTNETASLSCSRLVVIMTLCHNWGHRRCFSELLLLQTVCASVRAAQFHHQLKWELPVSCLPFPVWPVV